VQLQDTRASYDSRHFGASLEEGAITIWSSDSRSPIATVRPGFSGGMSRYSIDPVNQLIYSATWRQGLTCYDYVNDRVVWRREDLLGIQSVALSAGFPASVFVGLEAPDENVSFPGVMSGIAELNTGDGRTLWATEMGNWMHLHPIEPVMVIEDKCSRLVRILNVDKNEIGSCEMVHFAVLDVAFGQEVIALAEGPKGIRILDKKGHVVCHYAPQGRQVNCINVSFCGEYIVVFDRWDGAFVSILESSTGRLISQYERDSKGDICFIDNGSRFVDSSGRVCGSISGDVLTTLVR
jgi:hypothetical protein